MEKSGLVLGICLIGCGGTAVVEPSAPEEDSRKMPSAPENSETSEPGGSTPLPRPGQNATKSGSGIIWEVLRPGVGTQPAAVDDVVVFHVETWTTDGEKADSSVERRKPLSVAPGGVIEGMKEPLLSMVVGEKRRIWVPAALAYGVAPKDARAPAGDLLFELEVINIWRAPTPPKSFEKPPASAKCLGSGVCIATDLAAPPGAKSPSAADRIWVHYAGWRKNGERFDASHLRGRAASFIVQHVIKGWVAAIPEMKEGGSYTFWVPSDLAYGDPPTREGAPAGDLVFKLDLLSVEPTGLNDMGQFDGGVASERIRNALEGWWGWSKTNKVDSTCGGQPQLHSFTDNGNVLTLSKGDDQDPTVYDVLAIEEGVLKVALRPDKEGAEATAWEIVFRSPVEYCWRRGDWEEGECTASVLRCPLPDADN